MNGKRLSESRVPSGEQECPLQINDHIIIGNTKIVVSRAVARLASPLPPTSASTATTDGAEEKERKSIFTGNFQPNLNHPIFRALRDSMKEEEERQKRIQAKRKLYQLLTQDEKEERKRLRSQYTDRTARRQHLYKSTSTKRHHAPVPLDATAEPQPQRPLRVRSAPAPELPPQENKGRNLLKRMGWKEGEGLGRENEGIVEPIQGISAFPLLWS